MKRIGLLLIILVILYSTYYDLTIGTLPNGLKNTVQANTEKETTLPLEQQIEEPESPNNNEAFQEVVVEPGYTVLSIVEHLHEGPIPASIQEIIYDFEELNPGIKADSLQIGETYLFPLYLSE